MERKGTINQAQKAKLAEFMANHPELVKGDFSATFTYKCAQTLWLEITAKLNAIPNGANKDWKHWRKSWQDIKNHMKSKLSTAKRHAIGTGGGPPMPDLNETEIAIANTLADVEVDGLKTVLEQELVLDLSVLDLPPAHNAEAEAGPSGQQTNISSPADAESAHYEQAAVEAIQETPRPQTKRTSKHKTLLSAIKKCGDAVQEIKTRNGMLLKIFERQEEHFKQQELLLKEQILVSRERNEILKDIAMSLGLNSAP